MEGLLSPRTSLRTLSEARFAQDGTGALLLERTTLFAEAQCTLGDRRLRLFCPLSPLAHRLAETTAQRLKYHPAEFLLPWRMLRGEFTYTDMAGHIVEKMVRRHAHIFGDAEAGTAEEVTDLWAKIKEKEKAAAGKPRETSILDGVGHYLTSLNRAEKIQKKVAKVGFDWSDQQGIVGKIEEELAELKEAMAEGNATNCVTNSAKTSCVASMPRSVP